MTHILYFIVVVATIVFFVLLYTRGGPFYAVSAFIGWWISTGLAYKLGTDAGREG